MSACPAGHILYGEDSRVHISIWEERYQICPEDLGMLFFVGDRVPLLKKGPALQVYQISGQVCLAPSGQAVIIAIDTQRYMVPRNKFLAVALGEEASCDFFELPGDEPAIEIISPHKEGALS
ncbi:hypothetical protein [Methanoregula sp.]|uniref:hypothetical protein n=1 Tax=Methanoregula sp. TaxID=2052170 RepID=UPI003568897C